MPNWVEQGLHVVGRKSDIDSFIRTGFTRRSREQFDDQLELAKLCPRNPRERKDPDTLDSAVVLMRYRTRTQAFFEMTTAWDYPAAFYARLTTHWPALGFVCSVNGETGDFGGVLMALEGEFVNLVRDYDAPYDRRAHSHAIRRLLKRWHGFLTEGRDWRVVAQSPWEDVSRPHDAHFDDDFWYYFKSREEMAGFRGSYGTSLPQRRVGDTWQRTR